MNRYTTPPLTRPMLANWMPALRLVSVLLVSALFLGACTSPQMLVNERLQSNASVYPVQGRQGWLINQRLGFGEYQTGPVKRSWTKGYDYPFIVRFTGAKEKLSFSMQDSLGHQAEVFVLGKLRERDLLVFHKYFDINFYTKDVFTGTIVANTTATGSFESAAGKRDNYDFFVADLNQNAGHSDVQGHIRGPGLELEIQPVTRLDSGQRMLDTRVPGLEFVHQGQVVGAVETLNNGRVWLHNDLPEQHKLIIAAAAAALLLRSDLADHND